ncbi:MAG: asparagine synthase (glutamine-hydrolyzing) [Pirellulaceae bacterium]|nr:asparagine synthase (glutamine-hydrolyzing) [Planctomycetales bacterium]
MCGIVGIVDPHCSAEQTLRVLQRMTDVIVHRGPDSGGHIFGDGMGIGMRRLSIIDVAGGQQPIANESGDIHVVCNGEIYNFQEVRATLTACGHQFATGSDAEVIVHAYEEYGDDFVEHLRGMFGLAVWDQRRRRIVVARDRLGKKPLFVAQKGECFYFASEMKSLLQACDGLAEPDYRRLGQFLQSAFIYEPNTIYRHIQRLPAAHYGVWENERFSIRRYWSADFRDEEGVSFDRWVEQLDAALADAVKVRLHSEVPLGVFLSGGLDSSAVVAYAHAAGLKPLKTFTIGFDRAEWDESDDARRVADHFGTEHHLLRLHESEISNSFVETLQAIVEHCDEPFGDASAIPTYHVSRLARQHVTVILSGDGGDELFAGYSSYRGALFAERYRKYVPYAIGRHIIPALAQTAAAVLPGRWHYQALRAAKVCRDSALPLIMAYRDKTSIWTVGQLRLLLTPDFAEQADFMGEQYLPDPLWRVMQSDRELISRLTEIDVRGYMLDDILVKVDRMSMAHSLEVRSPLLDHRVVELAARMPSDAKIRGNAGKLVLRKLMQRHLPAATLRKPKQGFSVPLRDWFRGRLSSLVHDYLGPGGYLPEGIFSARQVARVLDEHRQGRVDHANRLWLLLTLAAWNRQYQSGGRESAMASVSAGSDVPGAGQ